MTPEIRELDDLTDVNVPGLPSETQTGLNQTAQTDTDSLMNLVGIDELDLSGAEGMTVVQETYQLGTEC